MTLEIIVSNPKEQPKPKFTGSLYEVLGVKRNAAKKTIQNAYKKLAKIHHPDKGGDPDTFKRIAYAYSILSNPRLRRFYDKAGGYTEKEMALARAHFFESYEQAFAVCFEQRLRKKVIHATKKVLIKKTEDAKASLEKADSMIAFLESEMKEFTCEEGENELLIHSRKIIASVQSQKDNATLSIKALTLAKLMADAYQDAKDVNVPSIFGGGYTTVTVNSGGFFYG